MSTLYYISVFTHIVCVAFWIGGLLFLSLVLLPGIKNHPDRFTLLYNTGITFRKYGWMALSVLFVTGIMNMYLRGVPPTWEFLTQSSYGQKVLCKMGLFVSVMILSSMHDFAARNLTMEEMQQGNNSRITLVARWTGRLMLVLSLIIVWLGVVVSRGG